MFDGDLSIVGLARDQRSGDLDELVIEWLVVQKDPIVIIIPVESVFNLSDGAGDLPNI